MSLFDAFGPRRPHAPPSRPADPPPEPRLTRPGPAIALALGGGVARGWSHIGALRALARHGIEPDIVVGTSIGAVVGAAYVADKLDVLEAWARSLTKLKMLGFMDLRPTAGGLIGGGKLFTLMHEHFGELAVDGCRKTFVAVAADLTTGHEVWLRRGRMVDAVRASFSLPGLFSPVHLDGRWLIDGALVNPLPTSPCIAFGGHVTIAVSLSGDLLGRVRPPGEGAAQPGPPGFDLFGTAPAGGGDARMGAIARRLLKRERNDPSIFGVMVQALNIFTDRLIRTRLASDPPDVVVTPRVGHIGLFEFDRAAEMIELGEAAVERVLPDIKEAIALYAVAEGAAPAAALEQAEDLVKD